MDKGVIVVLDTPGRAEGVGRATTACTLQTDDDEAAIAAIARALRDRARDRRGRGHLRRARRRAVRAAPVRRAGACRSARSASRGRRSTTSSCPTPAPRSATPRRAQTSTRAQPRRCPRPLMAHATAARASEPRPPRRRAARTRRARARAGAQRARRPARGQDRLAARADPLQPRTACGSSPRWCSRSCSSSCWAPASRASPAPARTASNLRTFVYPGVLCMAVLFTAMFSAASLVWDREFGFLREMMVAPVRRSSLVLGKCLGGATVACFQGVIVLVPRGPRRRPLRAGADPRGVRAAARCSRSRSPRSA